MLGVSLSWFATFGQQIGGQPRRELDSLAREANILGLRIELAFGANYELSDQISVQELQS